MIKKIISMIIVISLIVFTDTISFGAIKNEWYKGLEDEERIQHIQYDNKEKESDEQILSNARYALKMNGYSNANSFKLPETDGGTGHIKLNYTERMVIKIIAVGHTSASTSSVYDAAYGDWEYFTYRISLYDTDGNGNILDDSIK